MRAISLSKAIAERSEIYPDYADAMQMYVDRWPETIRGFFDGTLDIIRKLHAAGFPLYIVSNWADETWVRVEEDMTFLKYFQDRIISGQVGVAKPDAAIFDMARDRFPSRTEDDVIYRRWPKERRCRHRGRLPGCLV